MADSITLEVKGLAEIKRQQEEDANHDSRYFGPL